MNILKRLIKILLVVFILIPILTIGIIVSVVQAVSLYFLIHWIFTGKWVFDYISDLMGYKIPDYLDNTFFGKINDWTNS